jgi:hypothetical protein
MTEEQHTGAGGAGGSTGCQQQPLEQPQVPGRQRQVPERQGAATGAAGGAASAATGAAPDMHVFKAAKRLLPP